ncbi:MAG: hypothetical protein Q8P89_01760 [bacterium]|nr:hypothetical protein [bacterium]
MGPFSRFDFIVSDNCPYILELNTIPGLTPGSLYQKAALAEGIGFVQLMEKLIMITKKKFRRHKKGEHQMVFPV